MNESKIAAAESNYIHVVRRLGELEGENKELKKAQAQSNDKIRELEVIILEINKIT